MAISRRNVCAVTLPPTRYMLAVMLLASCVAPRAKLAFSWLPWFSWYSAGIGIKAFRPPTTRILLADTSHLSTAVNTTRCHSIVFVCPLDRPRGEKIAVSLLYYGPVALGTAPRSRLQRYLRNTGPILADAYKKSRPSIRPHSRILRAHVSVTVTSIVQWPLPPFIRDTPPFSFTRAGYIYDRAIYHYCLLPSTGALGSLALSLRTRVHSKTPSGRHTILDYRAPFFASIRLAVRIYLRDSWTENARSERQNPVTECHKTRPRVGYY